VLSLERDEAAGMIDAHVHFWRYSPVAHGWIGPEQSRLRRDFLPSDLEPIARSAGVTSCVAVQAAQSLDETRFLLDLADSHPFVEGVIGWVDLCAPDVGDVLARFAAHTKFRGVRHFAQDEPDPKFLLQPAFLRGIAALERLDLVFELLVRPRQLPAAIELVRRLPSQRFVLDHLGKPDIARGAREPWHGLIRELARSSNVTAKVSGLVTEGGRSTTRDEFAWYVDCALAAFGRERLVIGSDWPVCTLVRDYPDVIELHRALL
jgi:L-fuconolactonase